MNRIMDVNVGQLMASREHVVLRAMALGSCIGVAAYDGGAKVGGLAHVMLPGKAPDSATEKSKYAADAIDALIAFMAGLGADRAQLGACLAGAGNVLQKIDDTICDSNIASVIGVLRRNDIPIKATLLGGIRRKSISLDVDRGLVHCTEGDSKEKLLWDFFRRERKREGSR